MKTTKCSSFWQKSQDVKSDHRNCSWHLKTESWGLDFWLHLHCLGSAGHLLKHCCRLAQFDLGLWPCLCSVKTHDVQNVFVLVVMCGDSLTSRWLAPVVTSFVVDGCGHPPTTKLGLTWVTKLPKSSKMSVGDFVKEVWFWWAHLWLVDVASD